MLSPGPRTLAIIDPNKFTVCYQTIPHCLVIIKNIHALKLVPMVGAPSLEAH